MPKPSLPFLIPPWTHPESRSAPTTANDHPSEEVNPLPLGAMILHEVQSIAASLARLADHFVPAAEALVGTPYVATRRGCTTVWVAEMTRQGRIPKNCIVEGTGTGKPWKFHRDRIDAWLASR